MLRAIVSVCLTPPAGNLLLILFGWLVSRYVRWLGASMFFLGFLSLWLLATPIASSALHRSIEKFPALSLTEVGDAQAIIVLGAAHYDAAAEFSGNPAPVERSLGRLHYAAYLHRETGLPVMTTGGPMNRDQDIHAQVLATALDVYGIEVSWTEARSATTWQNALFSAEILHPLGIDNVIVLTHSYHMARASMLFELAGFNVIAAPTQLSTSYPARVVRYWLPDAKALSLSYHVLHEYLGLLWYSLVSPVGNRAEESVELAPY